MRRLLCLAIVCLMAAPVSAVTLDGSTSGDGYNLRSVQTVQTQFGDSNASPNNGSELDGGWAFVSGGNLNLVLTGNLENNYNKLNVFIDSVPGGENQITASTTNGGNNPGNDGWADNYNGFMFDAGFAADFLLINRNGSFGSDTFDLDFNSVGNTSVVESSGDIFGGSLTGSNASVGASGIGVAFDNSNVAGVVGGTGAADQSAATAVTTGFEFVIPLSAIGNPNPADIKISAMVNGSNQDYLSNQFLGGLASSQGNLTGPLGGFDMNNFAGDQFFNVVPEPASLALAGLAMLGLALGRGRKI